MQKATHDGTCQVCRRRHRLPGGKPLLAKHGYQVDYGCFNGTCWGSDEDPLEVSCELVKKSIIWASEQNEKAKLRVIELRKPATEPKGYAHVRKSYGRLGTHYSYEETEIKTDDEGTVYYETKDEYSGKPRRNYCFTYSAPNDPLQFATKLNGNYANHIEREIEQTERYITEQEEVVRTWEPKPLMKRAA